MKIGDYLLSELAARGVRHLFGVPGDYSLAFLDQVLAHPDVTWVGNCNELNAGYAADGYARITGLGAISLTFGVGELSAINAVGGAYAERVPLVVLGGLPARRTLDAGRVVHHGLGGSDWRRVMRAYGEVTVAQTVLRPDNAVVELTRALDLAMTERRPVYVGLPSDVPTIELPSTAPALAEISGLMSAPGELAAFEAAAGRLVAKSRRPMILLGHELARLGLTEQVQKLALGAGIPVAVTAIGKGQIDEQAVDWVGTYVGPASPDRIIETVERADCVLALGVVFSDTETAGFSAALQESGMIVVRPENTAVAGKPFGPVAAADALRSLAKLFGGPRTHTPRPADQPVRAAADDKLTQDPLWTEVTAAIRPGDVVVVDQGTPSFGMLDHRMPSGVSYLAGTLWGSIGYSLPAALGAAVAAPDRRVLLLIGDGSLQLTAQELSTMARQGANITIVLVNNAGYTIERAINGPTALYNDIAQWDHTALVRALCGPDTPVTPARTVGELRAALTETDGLRVIEAFTEPLDVPTRLHHFVAAVGAASQPPPT
jgi:indolepyruvate decarboxylase